MVKKLTTQSCIIAREDRLCYISPAHIPDIQLCNIFGSPKIRIRTMPTDSTFNKSPMSNSISVMADTTSLRGISRIDINNSNPFSQSLVFNKTLELVESPFMNPLIISGCCSDIFQIFHDDYVAIIQIFNNRFTNVVINPSLKQSPASTQFLEFSFGSFRAFRLENRNKLISLNSQLLNTFTIKSTIRSYCEFIDAEVNAQNSLMLIRTLDIFPSECKSEIIFFFRLSKQTFSNLPIKILQSVIRNLNRNLNSSLNSGNAQDIIFKTETSWGIISNINFIDYWIRLCLFNHPTRLFNTSNRKLRRQSHLSQILINKRMEFDVIPNLHTPSDINTMLESFFVDFNSFNNNFINFNFNWDTSNQHLKKQKNINYLNVLEVGIPPTNELVGILPKIL